MKFCFFSVLLFSTLSAFATIRVEVLFFKGEAYLKRNSQKIALKKGLIVNSSDTVVTGAKSLVILSLDKHSRAKIDPNTEVKISQYLDDRGKEKSVTRLYRMIKGATLFFIDPKKNKVKTYIRSGSASFGVRGTTFLAAIENGESWLSVKKGVVEVQQSGRKQRDFVGAGESIVANKSRGLSAVKKYNWSQRINWNFEVGQKASKSGFKSMGTKRLREYKAKRENWKKSPKRMKRFKQFVSTRVDGSKIPSRGRGRFGKTSFKKGSFKKGKSGPGPLSKKIGRKKLNRPSIQKPKINKIKIKKNSSKKLSKKKVSKSHGTHKKKLIPKKKLHSPKKR